MKNIGFALFLFIVFIFAPTESYSKRSLEAYEYWGVYYETSDDAYLLFGDMNIPVKLSDTSDKEYRRLSVTISKIEDFICYSNKYTYMTFYYRQDGDRIYRYDESSGNDLMLYDFGLSEGDIVEDGDGNRMLVEKVFEARSLSEFSMFVDGEKAFQLRGVDDPSLEDTWIENVGSIKTGLLLASDLEGMKTASLSFFTASKGRYSLAFPTNTDCLKAVPFLKQDAYPDDYDLDLYPDDDDTDDFGPDDDLDNYLLFDFIDDTLFVKGRLRQRMSPDEFDVIGGVVNNGTIYVFFQNMHFLFDGLNSIGSSDFEVKIPGFEPGTYTIKTLSLFMEMPDTTIVCHGPVTDIHNISTLVFQQTTNVIYDLQGRQLNKIPEQGIYIQGGKKHFIY